MSDWAQLITSIATLIASIGAVSLGWRNAVRIEVICQATNGLTARLITAATAQGNLEGRAELKQEQQAS